MPQPGITHMETPKGKGGTILTCGEWKVTHKMERGRELYQIRNPDKKAIVMVQPHHFVGIEADMLHRMLSYMLHQARQGADKAALYRMRNGFAQMHSQ
eukprot:19478-Lingulodinium_polyedra.AAC.1